ncbi:MAG: SDR family oxidoreductase [Endomicrobium sp.]|jgi:3-oxoacyl-[acyl-carrier protein] reductase|nr:SDR family oxidoreductase [Endomicrobium sp.]
MAKKNLLILGGSSAIAQEYVCRYGKDYNLVLLHYYTEKPELKNNMRIIQADFSDVVSTKKFIERILNENITHIIHIPAIPVQNAHFQKICWEKFQRGYDIQIRSAVLILQALLPKMEKEKYGKVVFVLSSVSCNISPKYMTDYVLNKYALLGLTKALSQEFATKKININAVSPSMMETKFLKDLPEIVIEHARNASPMKRNANTKDVVAAIHFLLSDESEYITGENLLISGGNLI